MRKQNGGPKFRLTPPATVPGVAIYNWDLRTGEFILEGDPEIAGTVARKAALLRQSWEALFHPDDSGRISALFQNSLKNARPGIENEYRILTTSGDYRWFMDRGKVTERNDKGEPRRITGVLVDISGRKAAEEMQETRNQENLVALRRSEEEKRAILEGLQGIIRVRYLAPDFRIIWSNAEAIEGSNTENRNDSPSYCYKLIRGLTEPCLNCEAQDTFETGVLQSRGESRLSDGRCFVIRTVPVKDGTGLLLGVIHIALNITQYKQLEEGLKTTNEFLHSLLGNSPTPICVYGGDGRMDTVNQAWEKTFGVDREQAVGCLLQDIFSTEMADEINGTNKRILTSNFPIELEESIHCPSGLHHFHTVKFPLQDATGQTVAVGAISVDVTARKRAERELIEREAELNIKSRQLEEMNTALRVLLRQREEDQRELEERIVSNVKELVLPYIHKLKGMHLNEAQGSYLEIVETHLNDIVTPFLRQIVSQYPHMTAKELQVATLVREGKANKEIADLMSVSLNAIEIHRYNLRKKLGLQSQKVNLRSYLLSLNKVPQ